MEEIDKEKWHEDYKTFCMILMQMTRSQAEAHFKTAKEFDYGYSPMWYVIEEMNVNYYNKKNEKI
jgi:hypothetical protein